MFGTILRYKMMNSKSFLIIPFLLSFTISTIGQSGIDLLKNLKWQKRYVEKDHGIIHIATDTNTLDSIYVDKYEFKRINKEGELIEYIDIETHNYCYSDGYDFTGIYKRFYNSGNLKIKGNLKCNSKIGEWFEYYKNGTLKKYENYLVPAAAKTKSLKQGLYKEYFNNGKSKVEGQYRIFESLQSFEKIDFQTYEIIDSCCSWQLVSRKVSNWVEFDRTGAIINETHFENVIDKNNLRIYPENLKRIE